MMSVKYWERNGEDMSKGACKVLNEYLNLKKLNRSEATIKTYKQILEKFLREVTVPLETLTKEDVLKWLKETETNKNGRTMELYCSCLNLFFQFCSDEGFMEKLVIRNIWRTKTAPSLPKYLTKEEYTRVRLIEKELPIHDRALIHFLFSTGCRSKEICELSVEDIDLENQTARVISKGRIPQYRYVMFSKECQLYLKEYLQKSKKEPTAPLFESRSGQRLQPATLSQITRKIGEKLKLDHALSPNVIRNTYAKMMLEKGADLSMVVNQMGIANYNTIFRYVKIISREDLKRSLYSYL